MDLGILGKRALVLASSRGLGLGVAQSLAAEGATVMLCGRNQERLAEAAAAINAKGAGRAAYAVADLRSIEAAAALIDATGRELGAVDILVNNSGGPPAASVLSVTPQQWQEQIDAMMLPIFEMTRQVLPGMQARGWGRILTIVSSGVAQPIPNLAISNALRASLVGWNKTLAAEVAADGVTANVILPGRIATERITELDQISAKREQKTAEEIAIASRASIPAKRYGTVAEFAAMAAFLCSAPASYVTGSQVRVDGGMIRSI